MEHLYPAHLFELPTGLLSRRSQRLVIHSNYLQLETSSIFTNVMAQLTAGELTGYRYGIRWIRGIEVTIGQEYQIFLQNASGKVFKIAFSSFWGHRQEELEGLYVAILNSLWSTYFQKTTESYLQKFNQEEPFEIFGINFSKEGITLRQQHLFKTSLHFIGWPDVCTKDFSTYFAIFARNQPALYWAFDYLTSWNVTILYAVIRTILGEPIYAE